STVPPAPRWYWSLTMNGWRSAVSAECGCRPDSWRRYDTGNAMAHGAAAAVAGSAQWRTDADSGRLTAGGDIRHGHFAVQLAPRSGHAGPLQRFTGCRSAPAIHHRAAAAVAAAGRTVGAENRHHHALFLHDSGRR